MSGVLTGSSPRAGRPDPVLAALLQLAQGQGLAPLGQEFRQGSATPRRPAEPGRGRLQQLPPSLLDVEPFGALFDLPVFDPRQLDPQAPRMFEYFTPGEQELLKLFDRLRQLPPIPMRPKPS